MTSRAIAMLFACATCAACGPVAGLRPATGIPDGRTAEVGGGAALVTPRPFVEEPTRATGQVWSSTRATERLTVTGIGAFDLEAIALGGALRVDVVRNERVALGGEGELGLVWGAASVPFALRLVGPTWLYTAPRLGTRSTTWALELPGGLDIRFGKDFAVRAEYRVSWTELDPFTRRHHAALGVAWFL